MPGFIHDALADINLMADNLRDRYKNDFAIIKELVQNADDGSAFSLDLGFSRRGLKNAQHPLFRGPGLLVVNNGPFEPTDYDAIRRLGLNSKAADDSSIGKFGLGMKSVFHLCEALFFLAEIGDTHYTELLSPCWVKHSTKTGW